MPLPQLLLLGAIAGYTIFLGLPFARLRTTSDQWRVSAGAFSAGVLLFLLIDVMGSMLEPIRASINSLGTLAILCGVGLAGLAVSYLGLIYVPAALDRRAYAPKSESTAEKTLHDPLRIAMLIAIGIGLHNFAEGLAIGQAAAAGTINLAWLLIVGFGLHNATEGFGITGPLVGRRVPSWKFLLTVGLIGGTPTFLGTIVGRAYTSDIVSTLFLAMAAGSIIYVVQLLIHSGLNSGKQGIFSIWLLIGLLFGVATELVVEAAGA